MAIVLQGKAAEKVQGQSINNNWIAVRVNDIILNIDHPKFEDYGGYDSLGTIYYTKLDNPISTKNLWASTAQIAKPLYSHIKYYPLINEIVLIVDTNDKNIYNSSDKSSYYLPQVNIWNHPHHNALPSVRDLESEDTSNDYKQTENGIVRRTEDGSTDIKLGDYFREQTNIKPLLPYEGDMIFEGRFGNSIRFGSTNMGESIPDENKNQWSQVGEVGNPITIIRNGQSENTDEKGWVPLIEDSNNDSSIIYMTSNQQITGFTPASLNQQSFGADIEEQKTLEQQLTDISPPAVIEPEVEEEVEVDETAFGSGGSEDDPVISTPQTSSLTGSQEIEDELTPFDEFAGDDEDLYYYEIVLSPQNLGNEIVEEEDHMGIYPLAGNLQVPLMNQGDTQWGHLRSTLLSNDDYTEYSVKAAGCALTSVAMVCSYYINGFWFLDSAAGGPLTFTREISGNDIITPAMLMGPESTFLPHNKETKIDTTPEGSGILVEWSVVERDLKNRTGLEYEFIKWYYNTNPIEEEIRDFLVSKLDAGIPVIWERKQDCIYDKDYPDTCRLSELIEGFDTSTFIYGYNSSLEKPAVQRKFVYGDQHWMVITGYTSDGNYDPTFQVNDPNGASFRPNVSLENLTNKLGRFTTLELKL